MFKRSLLSSTIILLTGCGSIGGETVEALDGSTYSVERYDLEGIQLPTNSDMRMVDNDLARYASSACGIDSEFADPPLRCDVFVQPHEDGNMVGYAFLTETSDGVQIHTNAEGCFLSGTIMGNMSDVEQPLRNAGEPFEGSILYQVWFRDIDDPVYSQVTDDNDFSSDTNTQLGKWYFERTEDKLRINQERWNYCDDTVEIDEVFQRAISFEREEA